MGAADKELGPDPKEQAKNRAFWVRSYLHATRLKWATLGPDESGYQNTQRQDVKRL